MLVPVLAKLRDLLLFLRIIFNVCARIFIINVPNVLKGNIFLGMTYHNAQTWEDIFMIESF